MSWEYRNLCGWIVRYEFMGDCGNPCTHSILKLYMVLTFCAYAQTCVRPNQVRKNTTNRNEVLRFFFKSSAHAFANRKFPGGGRRKKRTIQLHTFLYPHHINYTPTIWLNACAIKNRKRKNWAKKSTSCKGTSKESAFCEITHPWRARKILPKKDSIRIFQPEISSVFQLPCVWKYLGLYSRSLLANATLCIFF